MKNYAPLVLVSVLISFSSCQKDHTCSDNLNTEKISIVGASVIKSGTFNFTNKASSGTATIYLQKNGVYILAFEQMQFSSTADVDVKMTTTDDKTNAAIKLFSVKNITDHLYYELPPSININAFNYLFFQNDISDAPIADVTLK